MEEYLKKLLEIENIKLKLSVKPNLWLNGAGYSGSDGELHIDLNNKGEVAYLDNIRLIEGDIILHSLHIPYELEKDSHRYIFGKTNGNIHIKDCKYEIEIFYHDKLDNKYRLAIQGEGNRVKITSNIEIDEKDNTLLDNDAKVKLEEKTNIQIIDNQKIKQELAEIKATLQKVDKKIPNDLKDIMQSILLQLTEKDSQYVQNFYNEMRKLSLEQLEAIEELIWQTLEDLRTDNQEVKQLLQKTKIEQLQTKAKLELGLPYLFKIESEYPLNQAIKSFWAKFNNLIPQNLKRDASF